MLHDGGRQRHGHAFGLEAVPEEAVGEGRGPARAQGRRRRRRGSWRHDAWFAMGGEEWMHEKGKNEVKART